MLFHVSGLYHKMLIEEKDLYGSHRGEIGTFEWKEFSSLLNVYPIFLF